jgi:hypothetical protein
MHRSYLHVDTAASLHDRKSEMPSASRTHEQAAVEPGTVGRVSPGLQLNTPLEA